MDSYEYYLLYHKDSSSFISALSAKNDEIFVALEKLIEKKLIKFESEKTEIFKKVWTIMQESESNEKLDKVFEALLTPERREIVKYFVNLQLSNFDKSRQQNVLRVAMILVKTIALESSSSIFLLEISNHFIDILLRESKYHAEVLQLVKYILNKNRSICSQILNCILLKCQGRTDKQALQCLCNFFDRFCEEGISINFNTLLQKFFHNSAQKQGVFLIKTLVHRKKFNAQDEESFKNFTIVLEALEENQSHLILPSLSLIKGLKFSENYVNFWFVLVQMVLDHENSLIRNWGLNYVLDFSDHQFTDVEITAVLSALNATYLYDSDQNPMSLDIFQKFIYKNWKIVFRNMENINWVSVPCYKILKTVVSCAPYECLAFDAQSINFLLKQTEIIPKKVKNLAIRLGVQKLFAKLSSEVVQFVGLQPMIPVLINITKIKENSNCLQESFNFIQPEDYEHVFHHNYPETFIKSALEVVVTKLSLNELIVVCKNVENLAQNLMAIYCKLQSEGENHEAEISALIREICSETTENIENSDVEIVKSLELGLKTLKEPKSYQLEAPVTHLLKSLETYFPKSCASYFCLLKVVLELNFNVPATENTLVNMKNVPCEELRTLFCQLHVLQAASFNSDEMSIFLLNFHNIDDLKIACEVMEKLLRSGNENLHRKSDSLFEALDVMLDRVLRSDEKSEYIGDITKTFLTLAAIKSNESEFIDRSTSYMSVLKERLSINDKAKVLDVVLNHEEASKVFERENSLRDWLKEVLIEKVIETEILTKEQQIEMMTSCEIENELSVRSMTINDKLLLRLKAAKVLASKFTHEFPVIIETYMENFAKASRKKPRYFPNSWIHRMKLHCLQPIVLCEENLTQRTIEILVDEILKINNQLNVSILIEIILSRHYPSIVEILKDDKLVSDLKSPAFKSIFAIAVMQMRMEDSFTLLAEKFFGIAEMKLETIHDLIIPFTMGQNYSVRSYAQAAIIILYKHVKSVFGARESEIMSRIDRSCEVIKESMKFKNASKFIEVLKQDFRFSMKFDEIFTVESFYFFIPMSSKMPAEEITKVNESCSINLRFKIAEMENETESQVVGDEVAVPNVERSDSTSVSLQQKYLPYKYQIPGEKLMSTLPYIFESDDGHLKLRQQSNLIVVASLIDRAPNLGGLARTCEIFGTENYVIDSLKLTENSEFKALSKTAEKWLKISEVKSWQLFDYLLGMKQKGYSVIGAEQSGKSVSLIDVVIPVKSVLLLGNEKEGIPADLLSILDIIVEIPQQGVIRSLNVHVTGGIVIWEYAKQHLIK